MTTVTADFIGKKFVKAFYTSLDQVQNGGKADLLIGLFYGEDSQFVRINIDDTDVKTIQGRKSIQLQLKSIINQHFYIETVYSQYTFNDAVLVNVTGIMMKNKQDIPKAFVQTFILAKNPAQPSTYYVRNDILRQLPFSPSVNDKFSNDVNEKTLLNGTIKNTDELVVKKQDTNIVNNNKNDVEVPTTTTKVSKKKASKKKTSKKKQKKKKNIY